jgi:hypothetical protein
MRGWIKRVLIILALLSPGVAFLVSSVKEARWSASVTHSKCNIFCHGLACHNHHDVADCFPSGTVTDSAESVSERLSWMYSLLPYMEYSDLQRRMDGLRGWRDAANREGLNTRLPHAISLLQQIDRQYASSGDYVAIGGIGADAAELPKDHPRAGVFGYSRRVKIPEIRDGTANTMMFATCDVPTISMFAGGAETIRCLTQKPYFGGPDHLGLPGGRGCQVSLADGSSRTLSPDIDPRILEALATMNGGEQVPSRESDAW